MKLTSKQQDQIQKIKRHISMSRSAKEKRELTKQIEQIMKGGQA